MALAPGHLLRNVPTTLVQMDQKLARVTKEFQAAINNHQSQLARRLGVKSQTVQSWFSEGRISAHGAIAIGKLFPEWPKERVRPDIIDWKHLSRRKPGRV